jgi:hypothetical protein
VSKRIWSVIWINAAFGFGKNRQSRRLAALKRVLAVPAKVYRDASAARDDFGARELRQGMIQLEEGDRDSLLRCQISFKMPLSVDISVLTDESLSK